MSSRASAAVGAIEPDIITRVDLMLRDAVGRGASDIHLTPAQEKAAIRIRIDGLLGDAITVTPDVGRAMVTRLMVMAKLLTYRLDVPQEGRATLHLDGGRTVELRISVIPTIHGLRCAVRLPTVGAAPETLSDLGLPAAARDGLARFARSDGGLLVVTGPAGSGKTTTVYALLRHLLLERPELSIVSLEDPVERDLPGVAQVEVSSFGELTYERALRSILRQDPQVLALGEVRDAGTASLAVQASLSGHRLVCTMHAATAGGAVSRLVEMGLEPYQVTSSLFGVLNQRLLRRQSAAGYAGRVPVATFTPLTADFRRAILARGDAGSLDAATGSVPLAVEARSLIAAGVTDEAEVVRVLGDGS